MILAEVQQYIEGRMQGQELSPCYESYCLSKIPAAVLALLDIPQPDQALVNIIQETVFHRQYPPKIVVLLIDGFGWHQWLKYAAHYDFFNRVTARGVVVPITTVFPSTTAAALTTMHSGLTPQEHGLPEWWIYLDEIDAIVASLPFTPLGARGRDKLLEAGVKPSILFQGKTVYQLLAAAQIPSFTFIRDAYARSAYSSVVHKGSLTIPFISSSDLLVNLRQKLAEITGPAYFFVYWDAVDAIAHTYGPHTEQYHAELAGFSYLLQRDLIENISTQAAADTLLLVTADHGHINVTPRQTLYLNRYPRFMRSLDVGRSGARIPPWGSPRDLFLRVREERLTETAVWLTKRLKGKATVMTTAEAIQRHLFGVGRLHPRFKARIGNLMILPTDDHLIWFEHLKGKKFTLRGMHGGLRPDEMLIPFAAANLAALR
jgi:predicted AlkP superfamily pyrophosphatase or phosphodiesterase